MKADEFAIEMWALGRPENVRQLMHEFKALSYVTDEKLGVTRYLIGFDDDERVIFSDINPRVDYDGAMAGEKHYMAAADLRAAMAREAKPE